MRPDPFTEWQRCGRLVQHYIDRLIAAGVPPMSLAGNVDGRGYALAQDHVVVSGSRFEFERYVQGGEPLAALIVLALDIRGQPVDLVACRCGSRPFVASWAGRVPVLGMEHLGASRFPKPLVVHPDPLAWLRAEREGIAIVNPVQAALLLREASEIEVGSHSERRRLIDLMAVRLPRVLVRPAERRLAA